VVSEGKERISKVPGIVAQNCKIAELCRKNWGGMGAFEIAVGRLKAEYQHLLSYECNEDANVHLILTVDRDKIDGGFG